MDKTSPKRAVKINFIGSLHPDVRISKALYLLQTTDLSETQIAYEVGFVEMLTFEREFEKHTLMTPEEFRKLAPS